MPGQRASSALGGLTSTRLRSLRRNAGQSDRARVPRKTEYEATASACSMGLYLLDWSGIGCGRACAAHRESASDVDHGSWS